MFKKNADSLGKKTLTKVFDDFDTDHNGRLSKREIMESCAKISMVISEQELDDLMGSLDQNEDGTVSVKEFLKVMQE